MLIVFILDYRQHSVKLTHINNYFGITFFESV